MKGDNIPYQDHVVRYCAPKHIQDGQIQATAFMPRPSDESLSVNWLEFLNCLSRNSEINAIREVYSTKFSRVGARAKIATLNVGEVVEKVITESPDGRRLQVLHNPIKNDIENDPSHSGIYNLRYDDELIAELIVETIREPETYPARNP